MLKDMRKICLFYRNFVRTNFKSSIFDYLHINIL